MAQIFAISPANAVARRTLMGLAALMFILAIIVGWAAREAPVAQVIAGVTTLASGGFFPWFLRAQASSRVLVSGEGVKIETPLYGRTIAAAAIVPGSVRLASLAGASGDRLQWRTNGLGVPGYQLGWFRTAGGKKALVAAGQPDVVSFETSEGYSVFLGVDDAKGLESALGSAFPGRG